MTMQDPAPIEVQIKALKAERNHKRKLLTESIARTGQGEQWLHDRIHALESAVDTLITVQRLTRVADRLEEVNGGQE